MNTKNLNQDEFASFIQTTAKRVIKEMKEIESLGDPTKLAMNKNAENGLTDTGAKVSVDGKGKFSKKSDAPANIPGESETTKDPVDVKMTERDGGSDEEWSTAAAVKGTNSKKAGTKNHADGLAKPDVTSKEGNPSVSTDADPTQEGGVPGDKGNLTPMNKEDKEDKQTTPKTQVLGKGEMSKDGFSKGQTGQEINVNAKQESDPDKEKIDSQIKTIQLPESFSSKKELINFMEKEARRISKNL